MVGLKAGSLFLVVAVIPLLVVLYADRARKGGVGWGWTFKNLFFYLLIIAIPLAVTLEVLTWRATFPPVPFEAELDFLDRVAYEKDVDLHVPEPQPDNWVSIRDQLLRKFNHAEHAWDTEDYKEATKTLLELEVGEDDVGGFHRFDSFVVVNNLSCVYFKKKRNEDFQASDYLLKALRLVGTMEPYSNIVKENIRKLNTAVNTRD